MVGIASFIAYSHERMICTCSAEPGHYIIIGSELTPHARDYLATMKLTSCSAQLQEFAGVVDDIWTRQSIDDCTSRVILMYTISVLAFFALLISAAQTVSLALKKR